VEKSKDLDLVITIDALSLPTASRKDQLSNEPGKRLALASLEEYRKAIADRNVLSPYRPPPPVKAAKPVESEPKPEPFDASKFAFVTGIVEVNGEPQVWVKARASDEKYQLRQGDKFQVGPFSAIIARIDRRDVEIEVEGKRHTIPSGSSVRGTDAETKQPEKKEQKAEGPDPAAKGGGQKPEGEGQREEGRELKAEGGGKNGEGRGERGERRKRRAEGDRER
jgi:hypothetical protein